MEFHGTRSVPIRMTRAVPWNSMELGVRQFRWHEQFHGIPWNCMELEVRQFRWCEQFHGILRNLWCANFDDTSSSLEFHGTRSVPISMTQAVPWNSMELGVRQFRWHEQFHGIPWNSMELEVRQFRWHEQFHGILRNFWCANFDDTSSSMEFHGIPWNLKCTNFAACRELVLTGIFTDLSFIKIMHCAINNIELDAATLFIVALHVCNSFIASFLFLSAYYRVGIINVVRKFHFKALTSCGWSI